MMETLFVWCISEDITVAIAFQNILNENKIHKISSSIIYNNNISSDRTSVFYYIFNIY